MIPVMITDTGIPPLSTDTGIYTGIRYTGEHPYYPSFPLSFILLFYLVVCLSVVTYYISVKVFILMKFNEFFINQKCKHNEFSTNLIMNSQSYKIKSSYYPAENV